MRQSRTGKVRDQREDPTVYISLHGNNVGFSFLIAEDVICSRKSAEVSNIPSTTHSYADIRLVMDSSLIMAMRDARKAFQKEEPDMRKGFYQVVGL